MNVTIDIPDDIIRNAVGGAFLRYWAYTITWERESMLLELEERDIGLKETITIRLTREDFARGVSILATRYPRQFAALINKNGDAYTGDILVQCAAFGEERYA